LINYIATLKEMGCFFCDGFREVSTKFLEELEELGFGVGLELAS
jgi:hypothetical protein